MNLSMMLNPVEVRRHELEYRDVDMSTTTIDTQAKSHPTLIPLRELLQGIATLPGLHFQPHHDRGGSRATFVRREPHPSTAAGAPHTSHSTQYYLPPQQGPSPWTPPIHTAHHQNGYQHRHPSYTSEEESVMSDDSYPSIDSASQIHNNNKYTVEMIDWIRYHRVDRGLPWEAELLPRFFDQYPERYHPKATVQTLTSRYYRDNIVPELDERGKWQVDEKGHLKIQSAKVRSRSTVVGKDIPRGLVDKWPARLLTYTNWKCPVLEKDRERARRILAGNDPTDPKGKKAEWRRILKSCEHLMYSEKKGGHQSHVSGILV